MYANARQSEIAVIAERHWISPEARAVPNDEADEREARCPRELVADVQQASNTFRSRAGMAGLEASASL
jgi:hypothetical protein